VKYSLNPLSPLFLACSRSSTTFRSSGRDVRTPISSLKRVSSLTFTQATKSINIHLLFSRIDTIFLRCDKVEESFRATIQFVELPVLRIERERRVLALLVFGENREKKRPMM
jgi:hypothetical protein